MKANRTIRFICLLYLVMMLTAQLASAANWKTVTTITGAADQTTQPFKVTAQEWRLNWSYEPDERFPDLCFFGVAIFKQGQPAMIDSFYDNGSSQISGEHYIHTGNASFYLEILDANIPSYTIVIEQDQDTSSVPIDDAEGINSSLIVQVTIVASAVAIALVALLIFQRKRRKVQA